jgi:hypothetical protein
MARARSRDLELARHFEGNERIAVRGMLGESMGLERFLL